MTATRELPPHRALPPPRKPAVPGQPWSHQETVALIDAYRDLWYALKRGQLKAQQWEDVAAAVAARCGGAASKSGTQCRHKIEKLRKRYKSERARPPSSPSPWPYFDRMDRMDRGTEEDDDEEEEEDEEEPGNVRSINGILREGFVRAPSLRSESEGEAMGELAAVVRRFGEGMVRMEKRRMEMMREVERDWMEMEAKRAEMVMDSQRWLVDRVVGAFTKKARKCEASSYATILQHSSGVRNYEFPHDPLVCPGRTKEANRATSSMQM